MAIVVLGLIAFATGSFFLAKYRAKAYSFDLGQIDKMEAASVLYDRKGHEFGKLFVLNRQPVPFDQLPDMLVKAVIAEEDNRFYQHHGVDFFGIFRAAISNYRRGKINQGASTVTQQVARNSFELHERTYERKLVEIFLAQRIEQNFSKQKIMEMYLNRVYFGSGFYGAEAAARGYFGKPAKDLSIGQCATLAGLLKSPQALSPWNNREAAQATRDFVLGRMRELGFITRDQEAQEKSTPLYVMKRTNPFKTSYPVEYIRQQVIEILGYQKAMNGGFRIDATLDLSMQQTAERSVKTVLSEIESVPGYTHETFQQYREREKDILDALDNGNMSVKVPEPKYLQGAVLALDNQTGGILAMVGGRDFKHSEYNRTVQGKEPPGTAFTPIVYAAAYQSGIFPGEIVQDACLDNRYVMVGGTTGILGEWGVEQVENRYEGPMTTRAALVKGANAATVRLGMRIGLDAVKQTAQKLGITMPAQNFANTFLGSKEVSLSELTNAYTAFASAGKRSEKPYIISRISDNDGNTIFEAKPQSVQAISPEAAWQTYSVLTDVLRKGSASVAYSRYGLQDFPAAGKAGTAYNFTDNYFIGCTDSVTCGVWVGFDRPTKIFVGAFGKDTALPIWSQVMNIAQKDFPAKAVPKPDTLKEVKICGVSGLMATENCAQDVTDASGQTHKVSTVYTEYATEAEAPTIACDVHGGGVRDYAKQYQQEQWPRARNAINLAAVRPVNVSSPPVLGPNDVYNSVNPVGQNFNGVQTIPVAKAVLAPGQPGATPAPGDAPANGAPAVPVATPGAPGAQGPVPDAGAAPKVLPAKKVNPLDSDLNAPAIQAPTPEPIKF